MATFEPMMRKIDSIMLSLSQIVRESLLDGRTLEQSIEEAEFWLNSQVHEDPDNLQLYKEAGSVFMAKLNQKLAEQCD